MSHARFYSKLLVAFACVLIAVLVWTGAVFQHDSTTVSSLRNDRWAAAYAHESASTSATNITYKTPENAVRIAYPNHRPMDHDARPAPGATILFDDIPELPADYWKPSTAVVPRKNIAVSLVIMQLTELLEPALISFLASDIMQHNVVIFYWCNMLDSIAALHMRAFNGTQTVEVENKLGTNQGIVVPRIEVMQAILRHPIRFEHILEMHDDMYFLPVWFQDLIKFDGPHVGVLMPFIFNGFVLESDALKAVHVLKRDGQPEESIPILREKKVLYEFCIQVHPWLLKREMVEEIGYYDARYAPHQVEDDDFLFRLISGGWRAYAVRASWVVHRGGVSIRIHATDYLQGML
jgi:hypothetical protein